VGGKDASVSNFAGADGPDLGGFKGDDGGGVSVEGEKFDFIGFAVFINVHDGANVAGNEAFSGNGGFKDDTVVFVDRHSDFGYNG